MQSDNAAPTSRTRPTLIAAAVHLALLSLVGGHAMAQTAPAPKDGATLQEVKVIGTAETNYAAKTTSSATKTDTLLRDTPQAITVITQEFMRDQAMQNMADVIRYVPGIVTSQGEGNRDAAVFRGSASTADFFIDGVRDDVQYFRDFYNIDSVEALKGSNAMIFGRGGSGGVINRVSKTPQWNSIAGGSLTLGRWNNRRATADLGQAINDKMAFRVNVMAEDSDSFREGVTVRRAGINPTLAIRAGANTSVLLGYEHFRDTREADRGIASQNRRPYDADPSTIMGDLDNSPTWSRVNAFSALLEHDFGNGVTLRNRSRYADYDKFYQNVYASSSVSTTNDTLTLAAYNNATGRSNLFNQTDLMFSVSTGALKHKISTGLELGRQETDNLRMSGKFGFTNAATFPVSAVAGNVNTPVNFARTPTDAVNSGTSSVAAVYLQDQIELGPQWQAIVGLRYDRFSVDFLDKKGAPGTAPTRIKITDTPVSPRVGLVYKPFEAMSLYGSYSVAFQPRAGEQLSSLAASTAAFEPEEFENIELGAKWDVSDELSATAALYRLERSNVVVPTAVAGVSELAPGQTSKGVELGLAGKLTKRWSVMGGFAWQESVYEEKSGSIAAGTPVAQVPKTTLSLWNRYQFTPAWAAGLGLVYRDEMFAGTGAAKTTLPGYTRVDGAVFYQIDAKYKVQANIENLLDKKYYASAHNDNNITPGSPRALRVTLHAKF
ncbi:TonB-dependent receptor [Massilia glaciei]|uniref:TonB-dependent siderophore receptor n=1 Tax=Massilia glaciei TaxID=1524097 RepID=A0A2U2H9Y5_9BURK|nr:TonB-dependent siderophore receptor [Massilia glaciei]PWF39436.1 TonB-dependent siderophore receptor [Massilia glaciei]